MEFARKYKDKIRVARAEKKMSQRDVADALGIKQQMVSSWERGEDPVAKEHWATIKELLGVDVEALYAIEDQEASQQAVLVNSKNSWKTDVQAIISGPPEAVGLDTVPMVPMFAKIVRDAVDSCTIEDWMAIKKIIEDRKKQLTTDG